ncbi:MAG: hypothetical protein CTY16_20685 [Methylobacter sp.]|nr:MAG: hypothetical protein CTY16_20685 [Methylobacter sp.]
MKAIVPLNIAAIRVSPTDNSNVVTQFKGRVANFDNLPYGQKSSLTSTGDAVVQLLESNDSPQAPLYTGIHLHWELPDYFRKGVQPVGGSNVIFPQVPNRWLVVRYLSVYNPGDNTWGAVSNFSWVVESDYISMSQLKDMDGVTRPSVPVPLPVNPAFGEQPYRFMGRVVNASEWPKTAAGDQYLSDFNDEDGNPCYLNSIGFLDPGFSSYYPDCCSVFGFLDRFLDNPVIYNALKNGTPIQFKASYQVMGWISDGNDPLDGIATQVVGQYQNYVTNCNQQDTEITKTPADFFTNIAQQNFRWLFNKADITYTLDANKNIETLDIPDKTICTGIAQEIVWDMLVSPGTSSFLGDPETPTQPGVWTDNDLKVAIGNTSIEALSALLKYDNGNTDNDPDLLGNYEYLLDALQLGLLNNLEAQGNNVIALEEALHSSGFAREQGGLQWIVQQKPSDPSKPPAPVDPDTEISLPLTLAEELNLLNQAQKNYDMGRGALKLMRRQLYMDWYRYIKMYAGNIVSPNVSVNALTNFLTTKGKSELDAVVNKGNAVGVLVYISAPDNSGSVIDVQQPAGGDSSAAYAVWDKLNQFKQEMGEYPDWQIIAVPAPSFWLPTDPVAVMEGSRMEPARRNGATSDIQVRLTPELLGQLGISYNGNAFSINAATVPGQATLNTSIPYQDDFSAVIGEACLLIPSLAPNVATALQGLGGGGTNPAVADYSGFVTALSSAQGGVSGLEKGTPLIGLYNAVRQPDYVPVANPVQAVTVPLPINVTFTNTAANGWVPDAVQWNTQMQYPEFSENRYDPFLPVSLIWNLSLDPLQKKLDKLDYSNTNLTDFFQLNPDAIDYQYSVNNLPITTGDEVSYDSSVVMSKKATFSLTYQIDSFEANYPNDPADPTLSQISNDYKSRKILSQTMSGLNVEQLLCYYIPQISVEDLTMGSRDSVTTAIKNAALTANVGDNWYDYAFNSQAPIPTGPQALANFGPLRGGFFSVNGLEVVDVFGQRMVLGTPVKNPDGSLQVIPAMTMAPLPGDTANAGKIFLPPRILAPTRLWFHWLSAAHNNTVSGISSDFVEMNTHPATSPVCGWVLPNHLDNSLFFYDAEGAAVGSFGVEHGNLRYRTRAGNINNPSDMLSIDIGPYGDTDPPVNVHLANFMWYINNKSGGAGGSGDFLTDLMQAILNSDRYINPANFAQDASLSVLIGRPLAISRSIISMETSGNLLPLNQADTQATDPWPLDVNAGRYEYTDRIAHSTANLDQVQFPLRLGDLSNIDDGLVGYLIEQNATDPYGNGTFYAPAANPSGSHGVSVPSATNIQLTLNASPIVLTLLMDPRAAVHATAGVLPVEELGIPADQYSNTLKNLQMTFFTTPVLQKRQGLIVPLPAQSGYVWSWLNPGDQPQVPLAANASNSNSSWDYTPQTLLEGWLALTPDPNPAPDNTN